MIHPTAFIHPSAHLHPRVNIGYNAYIGPEVEIGEDCIIHPFAMITGPTRLGKHNTVFSYACLGEAPQDYSYKNEPTRLEIGDHNIFREGVTVHRGTVKGGGITRIGQHNFFLASSHVGHDCQIGDHNIVVNFVGLSGHVQIDHHVNLSAYSGIHQFCRIGAYAMISHAAMVSQDVPPFILIAGGDAPYACGLNVRGLQRQGFSSTDINNLKKLYKIFYREGYSQKEALARIEKEILPLCPKAQIFLDFVHHSQRGILRK